MWRGGTLHGGRIAYETWGTLNERATTRCCSSPGCRPRRTPPPRPRTRARAGGKAWSARSSRIDSNRYFVICVNSLGSCFGSTGPASIDPATGQRYRLTFPDLSVEDIARAGYETARALGDRRASTPSWAPRSGGMVVLAYAAHVPERRPAPGLHLRHRRGLAVRHRAALHPARGDHQRPGLARRRLRPGRRAGHAASAWRASSAPSPTARRPSGSSASAASRSGPT